MLMGNTNLMRIVPGWFEVRSADRERASNEETSLSPIKGRSCAPRTAAACLPLISPTTRLPGDFASICGILPTEDANDNGV